MTLAALLDAGCDLALLRSGLEGLQIPNWTLSAEKVWKNGMSATFVRVTAADQTKHRSLSAILEIFDKSPLSNSVRKNAAAIFHRLGEAEASRLSCETIAEQREGIRLYADFSKQRLHLLFCCLK